MKKIISLLAILAAPIYPAEVLPVSKTPYEQFIVGADLAKAVGADTIVLDSVTVTDQGTQQNLTAQMVMSSPAPAVIPSTKTVACGIKGGINGHTYTISFKVIDSTTMERYEGIIVLKVVQ